MSSEQPQAEAAPSKPKLPILIGMVAVGLAVGGGTGAAVLGPMVAKKMGKATPIVAVAHAESDAEAPAAEHGEAPAAEGEHAAPEGKEGGGAASVLLLENLVLNPAGSGGSRFLLLSVAIEAGKPTALEQFKARDAELRDIILTALGTKTVDELTDISKREQFKTELQAAVDGRFGKQSVKRLYFPQFVVQ
ncbi:MAG TPA: flagellar basal body-associated FliL family protein [Gemmatimonas sp.]|uniref:flagellar basal body-associated FliL family protein n=1 Tax=Gemmatimonas sp. TaxID=1962908 RepID=UPI002ED9832E